MCHFSAPDRRAWHFALTVAAAVTLCDVTTTTTRRAVVSLAHWTPLAEPVADHFNARLCAVKLPSGSFSAQTRLDRMLGKELCILLWALEQAETPEHAEAALVGWLALRPEERWWLFMMAAGEGGAPEDAGAGWRMALFYMLTAPKSRRRRREY